MLDDVFKILGGWIVGVVCGVIIVAALQNNGFENRIEKALAIENNTIISKQMDSARCGNRVGYLVVYAKEDNTIETAVFCDKMVRLD